MATNKLDEPLGTSIPSRPRLASVLAAAQQLPRQRSRREIAPPVSLPVSDQLLVGKPKQDKDSSLTDRTHDVISRPLSSTSLKVPSKLFTDSSSGTAQSQKVAIPPRPSKEAISAALEKRRQAKGKAGTARTQLEKEEETRHHKEGQVEQRGKEEQEKQQQKQQQQQYKPQPPRKPKPPSKGAFSNTGANIPPTTKELLRSSSMNVKKLPPPVPVVKRDHYAGKIATISTASIVEKFSSIEGVATNQKLSMQEQNQHQSAKGLLDTKSSSGSFSSLASSLSNSSESSVATAGSLQPPQHRRSRSASSASNGTHYPHDSPCFNGSSDPKPVPKDMSAAIASCQSPLPLGRTVSSNAGLMSSGKATSRQPKTLARARVEYSNSEASGHLSFAEGQIIEILDRNEAQPVGVDMDSEVELWKGRAICDGKVCIGLFPSIYVALTKSSSRAPLMPSSPAAAMCIRGKDGSGKSDGSCEGYPNGDGAIESSKTPISRSISDEILRRERHCNTLFYALVEVVSTELRHVSDLRTVHEVFIKPFEALFGAQLSRKVFSDWEPLLRVHEQVLLKLFEGLPTLNMLSSSFSAAARDPVVQQAIRLENGSGGPNTQRGIKGAVSAAFGPGVLSPASYTSNRTVPLARSGRMQSFFARTVLHPGMRISAAAEPSQKNSDYSSGAEVLVSPERADELLRVIQSVERVHKEHLSDFMFLDNKQIDCWSKILADTTVSLCHTIVEMSDWLKLCIPCVVNQPNAVSSLIRSKAVAVMATAGSGGAPETCRNVTPKVFIKQQGIQERTKLNNLDLPSFLIKPMQRITKYPLLMRELVKLHEKAGYAVPQEAAQGAFDKMSSIANKVNEIMKQHLDDHSIRMAELSQQLKPRETVQRLGLFDGSKRRKLYRFGKCSFQTITTTVSQRDVPNNSNNGGKAIDNLGQERMMTVESKVKKAADAKVVIPGQNRLHASPLNTAFSEEKERGAPLTPASPASPSWSSFSSSAASHLLAKHEGVRTGACYAMLFTSALVFAVKALNKWKTKTKYQIVKVIEVQNITSVSCMEGCLSVRTACSNVLVTPLEDDVLRWQGDIEDCKRVVAADRERQDVADAQKQNKKKQKQQKASDYRVKTVDHDLVPPPRPNSAELYRTFMQELQTNEMFAAAS